jgi:hypothetical protein
LEHEATLAELKCARAAAATSAVEKENAAAVRDAEAARTRADAEAAKGRAQLEISSVWLTAADSKYAALTSEYEAATATAREAQTREWHLTARAEAAVASSVALENDLEMTADDLEKACGVLASTAARDLAVAKDALLDNIRLLDMRAVAIRRAKADVLVAEIDRMQAGVKQGKWKKRQS